MTVPNSQSLHGSVHYIPRVVSALKDLGGVAKASAVRDAIVASMTENGEPFNEAILNGGAIKYQNDIAWARMHLVNTGMLEPVKLAGHGVWKLTQDGWSMPLDLQTATQIYNKSTGKSKVQSTDSTEAPTDEELQMELPGTDTWEQQLKKILRTMCDKGFERLCADIMAANGLYATKVTGKSSDKGIDGEGLLAFDKLSLVSVRVAWQCKRFESGKVPSKAVRDFRGSLDLSTAHGIFFTTSAFTAEAVQEACHPGKIPINLVVLGDLVNQLRLLGLGVSESTPHIVDMAYFDKFLYPTVDSSTGTLPFKVEQIKVVG
jgi:restriction system protein